LRPRRTTAFATIKYDGELARTGSASRRYAARNRKSRVRRGRGGEKERKKEEWLAKIFYSLSLALRARARARDGDARATAPRVSIAGILAIMHRVCNTISRD